MTHTISLIPIDRDGSPRGYGGVLSEFAVVVCDATAAHYESVGFDEPWIGYLAFYGRGDGGRVRVQGSALRWAGGDRLRHVA